MLFGMHALRATAAFLCAIALAPAAAAQGHGGVGQSGMDQGEARIATRSDVRLSMESLPGTSGAQVSALGTRVGGRMARIRGCYEQTVAEDPTVTGTLRLRLLLEEGGEDPVVEVDRDGVGSDGLVQCVARELGAIDTARLRRPTRAVVQLEFASSAAEGAERTARRAREARQVQITIDADGNATASGGTPDGHVRFALTGEGRESAPAVVAAHRALRRALPGLMDCRRRAGRRGHSPEGEVAVILRLREGRPTQSRVGRSTVASDRARGCVRRVLRRIEHWAGGTGRVRARIRFAGAEAVPAARD
jgi:hypothetical protein